jgi:hypothetical protein
MNRAVAEPGGATRGEETLAARRFIAEDVVTAADDSLLALRNTAARLTELAGDAEALEARVRALGQRERELVESERRATLERRNLDRQAKWLTALAAEAEAGRQELADRQRELERVAAQHAATAAELAGRETDLQSEQERLRVVSDELGRQGQIVEETRSQLQERAEKLDQREVRFASRWRWLLRASRWRPLTGSDARLCQLIFVPSKDGYKLLEQDGVALQRGATVTGLLAENRTFVVSKIAPWFDDRWCAYLQQRQPRIK